MFFLFNDTATTEIYTLSLHDALPILTSLRANSASTSFASPVQLPSAKMAQMSAALTSLTSGPALSMVTERSEEHTSELQSHVNLVCRLLLEKKNNTRNTCHESHPNRI